MSATSPPPKRNVVIVCWFASMLVLTSACAEFPTDLTSTSNELEGRICATGPTLKGIDVSTFQNVVNWSKVKADGISFAFARVSDGVATIDDQFENNWAGIKAQGIVRGAYQYFRPSRSASEQAQLFLDKVGQLEANDLAPALDIETTDGLSPTLVMEQAQTWLDIVEAATGRKPIIYTGPSFWIDDLGGPNLPDYPLWISNYGASCPFIPSNWDNWAFWQSTDAGTTDGVEGGVDTNTFNGDMAALMRLTGGGPTNCDADRCPPCGVIDSTGGVIDDGDKCFAAGGDSKFLRKVSNAGNDGDLMWTYATEDPREFNFAKWNLHFAQAGRYRVEVFTDAAHAQSKKSSYTVRATQTASAPVVVDQSLNNGWQLIGEYEFAAGGDQFVYLGDNTGEPSAAKIKIAFDAVRLTRVDSDVNGDDAEGCCSATNDVRSTAILSGLMLLALWPRRRRRRLTGASK